MIEDRFHASVDSPMAPSEFCFSITPSDIEDLSYATKAIYVGEGGDITLRSLRGNEDVTFRNVSSGMILDVRALAVRATGTTALDLVGLG